MLKNIKYSVVIISVMISLVFLPSCKDFLNPAQDLELTQEKLYGDWFEYRSVGMGLYGLQSKLVEQLVVLGELRGDLLTVTPNADADLVEINNFKVSKTNKYASPTNFFKLIASCNNLIRVLKAKHPEVVDMKNINTSNYDKLYGEAMCMRAWAYFNAVRIYGKVPVIHESLTSVEEIEQYVNSTSTYRDTSIVYEKDGFTYHTHDTIITLTKQFYDVDMVENVFINQLEKEVKVIQGQPIVGVDYNADKDDGAWEVTVWNPFAWHALLGQMYLTQGNLNKAKIHFEAIVRFPSTDYRYQLDSRFALNGWRNIFMGVPDIHEHIFTLQFNKNKQEQNGFQRLFDYTTPGEYMMKPTKAAIQNWEGLWRGYNLIVNTANPALTRLDPNHVGNPSDFYRGYGTSYYYVKNNNAMPSLEYSKMLLAKYESDSRTYNTIMDGVDTVVYKYSIGKSAYDQDASFIVYRAGGIHLELAEVYTWLSEKFGDLQSAHPSIALSIVNDGSYYSVLLTRPQYGIRGRAGYYTSIYDLISTNNIIYQMDPNTNKVLGYVDYTNNLPKKQTYLEEQIMDEKARELAFEGERFYDLIRVQKRRRTYMPNDDYLAKKVSGKYPAGQRQEIYNYLLDEKNWYINMFN